MQMLDLLAPCSKQLAGDVLFVGMLFQFVGQPERLGDVGIPVAVVEKRVGQFVIKPPPYHLLGMQADGVRGCGRDFFECWTWLAPCWNTAIIRREATDSIAEKKGSLKRQRTATCA